MKIEFTKSRQLDAISRTVKPGDVLESSATIPEALLQAYVSNGIAKIQDEAKVKPSALSLQPSTDSIDKGE
jgi:hypothetical protein